MTPLFRHGDRVLCHVWCLAHGDPAQDDHWVGLWLPGIVTSFNALGHPVVAFTNYDIRAGRSYRDRRAFDLQNVQKTP